MKKIYEIFKILTVVIGMIIGIDLISNYAKMQTKQLQILKEANQELKKDLDYEKIYELEQKKDFSLVFGMFNFIIYTSLFLILILGFNLAYDEIKVMENEE